jgi:hypothetical protein
MNMLVAAAATATLAPRAAVASEADPIHQAIADHEAAYAAYSACLDTQFALEDELPADRRQSDISQWETKIVETDDPRWIDTEKNRSALSEAEDDTALELIITGPTTLAGAAALMQYVTSLEEKGHSWPAGLREGDEDKSKIGHNWEVYLHRNLAAVLVAAAATPAA